MNGTDASAGPKAPGQAAHSVFSSVSRQVESSERETRDLGGSVRPGGRQPTASYSSAKYTLTETQVATNEHSFVSRSPNYSSPAPAPVRERGTALHGAKPSEGRPSDPLTDSSAAKPSHSKSTTYESAFHSSRLQTVTAEQDARGLLESETQPVRRVVGASTRQPALTTLGTVPTLRSLQSSTRTVGEARLVSESMGEARLVDVRAREDRVIEERVYEGESRIVGERELKRERKSETRQCSRREIEVDLVRREKVVEIIKENAVPYEEYVDVAYDVVVDVPIQRTIEREVITETLVEIPIEKVVEVPVEQLIEVPLERVVEVPVEVKRFVEVPVERLVPRPFDSIRENVVYTERIIDVDERDVGDYPDAEVLPTTVCYEHVSSVRENPVYVERVVEVPVEVPCPRVVEIPVERVVERRVPVVVERPVPVDREIVHTVDVPVMNEIRQVKEIRVERPVYRENVIEKRVERERLVEKEVIVPVEHVVEVPRVVENVVEKRVEMLVEVPVAVECVVERLREHLNEVTLPVERVVARSVEKVLHKKTSHIVQTPREFNVVKERFVPRERERSVGRRVNRFIEVPVERVVERPVYLERVVENPVFVQRTVNVPIESVSERITMVERIVEKPVMVDRVVEVFVENIIVRDVHVPVERVVEVPVCVDVPRPVFCEQLVEEEVLVELLNEQVREELTCEEYFEHEDEFLARKVRERQVELNAQMRQNGELRDSYLRMRGEWEALVTNGAAAEERDNILLHARLEELSQDFAFHSSQNALLRNRCLTRSLVADTQLRKDPRMAGLKSRLATLLAENNHLADEAGRAGGALKRIFGKF